MRQPRAALCHTALTAPCHWMDARSRWRDDPHMPLDLTHAELATAATACRAMAYQEGARAKKMENPGMRGPVENAAQRNAALAEKFEAVRKLA